MLQQRSLEVVWRNAEPARTAKRSRLRVAASDGVDWDAVKRAAEAFRKRTERYMEANRRVG